MSNICVFCGSSSGQDPVYRAAATAMGQVLVRHGRGLVYGGGSVGLMGVIADSVLAAGGNVIGVIPEKLAVVELLHRGVRDMRIVPTMHVRKALMAELSDSFIALPGGYGTLEELFEVITWAQLGIHSKPIGILNTNGYFDALLSFVDRTIADGFIKPAHLGLFVVATDPEELLQRLQNHHMPIAPKWISQEQS
ncbi:MAG: TIGR00730 family Rossman fold protein [Planctomycetota bacterium]